MWSDWYSHDGDGSHSLSSSKSKGTQPKCEKTLSSSTATNAPRSILSQCIENVPLPVINEQAIGQNKELYATNTPRRILSQSIENVPVPVINEQTIGQNKEFYATNTPRRILSQGIENVPVPVINEQAIGQNKEFYATNTPRRILCQSIENVPVPVINEQAIGQNKEFHAVPSSSHAVPSYSHAVPSYSHAVPSYSHAVPSSSHAVPSSSIQFPICNYTNIQFVPPIIHENQRTFMDLSTASLIQSSSQIGNQNIYENTNLIPRRTARYRIKDIQFPPNRYLQKFSFTSWRTVQTNGVWFISKMPKSNQLFPWFNLF